MVLATALGVVAVLLIGAAIAIWTIDVNTLVVPIRDRVKAATGRDLRIDGGLSLQLSLEPRLEMREVTLGNAPWASTPSMISAKRLDAQIALLPLLQRRFDIRHIALVEPVIALETDANGRGNWEVVTPDRAPSAAPADTLARASAIVGVGDIDIDRGVLTYRNGQTGTTTRVTIDHLDLHSRDLQAPVNATFRGAIDGVPLALTGHAGSLSALLERRWPYPVAVEGEVASRKVKAEAKMKIDEASATADDLALTIGGSDLRGSVVVAEQAGHKRTTLRLSGTRVLAADLVLSTAAVAPAAAPGASKAPAPARGGFFPTASLSFGALRDANVDGDIAMGELLLADGRRLDNVHVRFTISGGRLDAPLIDAGAFGGRLHASITIDAHADPARVHLTLAADEIDLGAVLASAGNQHGLRGGRTQVRGEIDTRGASVHDWASQANGNVSATVGPAALAKTDAARKAPVMDLLTSVLPGTGIGEITELRCAVVRLPIANGVARVNRSIGIETNRVGLVASGVVNLRDETIDLTLRPTVAGNGPANLAQLVGLVHWRGPWHEPRASIDPIGSVDTVARLGSLLAGSGLGALTGVIAPRAATPAADACAIARGAR